jgi:hypothetical protein
MQARLTDTVFQVAGIVGLFHTFRRTIGWAWHLFRGGIERQHHSPVSEIPMHAPDGAPAAHALPGTRLTFVEPPTRSGKTPIVIKEAA